MIHDSGDELVTKSSDVVVVEQIEASDFSITADALSRELEDLRQQVASLTAAAENRPRLIALSSLPSGEWELLKPLLVEIRDSEGESVTVHSADLEVWGIGSEEYSAIEDFRRALMDELEFLLNNQDRLGPIPMAQLGRFQALLRSKQ
jgi:hypothetical protein